MKTKLIEHLFSILLVSGCLIALAVYVRAGQERAEGERTASIKDFMDLEFVDYNDPFHKALMKDVMNIYYPGQADKNDELLTSLFNYKQDRFVEDLQTSHLKEELTGAKFVKILGMFVKFIIIYLLVMALTYYGVQTLGTWRFVRKKQLAFDPAGETGSFSRAAFKKNAAQATGSLVLFALKKTGGFFISLILFSPAYVIAYSLRTEFNTDVFFFVILLGVVSNGLLMMYTNKFHSFLTAESRKGYVETALAKNLNSSYALDAPDGISLKELLRPVKRFRGHVLGHVFQNAQHQYLSTLKEQAAFVITGLVIIEMALNIHGHLSYEMLRQLLHRNFDIVVVILLCIFYTVKITEAFTDMITQRIAAAYSNEDGP